MSVPVSLVLSRQPLAVRPLHEWLDDTVTSTVLLTTKKAVAGFDSKLDGLYRAHRLVTRYQAWVTERTIESLARHHGVERVASTSEHDVLRSARLRERLGCSGQGVASATAYRDKVVMKRLCADAGIAVPAFTPVDSPADLFDFLDEHALPAVVKPRLGFGSEDVRRLDDEDDVVSFLAAEDTSAVPYVAGQWMVESFQTGGFFHVDGMMVEGRIIHCWPGQYTGGLMERVRDDLPVGSVLLEPIDPRTAVLQRFAADVVAALPLAPHPLAFHLEAWLDPDPVLCEIACRAGGGLIASAYGRAFGVEPAREGLRAQCGSPLSLTTQPSAPRSASGWVFLAPGHGRFVPPPKPCPFPEAHVRLRLEPGAQAHGVQHTTDAAAEIVVEAATERDVRQILSEASNWWVEEASWI